ncbi:hypothetical protein L226DRAFT_540612 [Lentinus tigrinus ALCF2SS1-7]|uniref:uncharacterized protein n=1 Tax=Lentinus tigrinus ALCF2SS1-7 TaxID=1328758 RepID=UPI001165C9C9|nr:hypothetical protein L226DRAFT_540612 [Lentinus tigrinus ALCF2SS1-7]
MSSDTDASDLVAVFSDLYQSLFIYEVLITLDREVACFWTSKQSKSGARLLFLANKWISVIVSAMAFAQMANLSSDKFTWVGAIFPGLQFIPGALFSALRGYVLSRSKPLALLILILSLTPLGGFLFPPFGCTVIDDTTESLQTKLLYISRIPLIVADTLLICITWSKLISREALRGIGQSKRLSLSDVLLRDGTSLCITTVLFVMNVLHFSLSLAALAIGADGASNVSIFTAPKRTSRSSESTSTTHCTPRGTPTTTCRASSLLLERSSTRT